MSAVGRYVSPRGGVLQDRAGDPVTILASLTTTYLQSAEPALEALMDEPEAMDVLPSQERAAASKALCERQMPCYRTGTHRTAQDGTNGPGRASLRGRESTRPHQMDGATRTP
jgi:hypothetical protein